MRPTVLIADTDAESRDQLLRILSDYEVTVRTADDSDSAFRTFLESSPSLIFIDVFLPRRGGIEFLKRIRAVAGGRNASAVMLCGVKGFSDLRDEALSDLDARAFLTKPLRDVDLINLLDRIFPDRLTVCDTSPPVGLFPDEPPPQRGDLDQVPFISVFKYIMDSRFTGTLHLVNDRIQKAVYLDGGRLVFASSNRVAETLGRYMLQQGLLSQEVYEEALGKLNATGMKFGQILQEMGALSADEVENAVRDNIISKVTSVFSWTEGKYALGPTDGKQSSSIREMISPAEVLLKGILEKITVGDIFAVMRNNLNHYIAIQKEPSQLANEVEMEENDRLYLENAGALAGKTIQQALSSSNKERDMRLLLALFALDYFSTSLNPDQIPVAPEICAVNVQALREAKKTLSILKGQNYFAALGVPLDTNDEGVKQSYQDKVKKYHPDKLPEDAPRELSDVYAEIFVHIREAYATLSTSEGRHAYLEEIRSPSEARMMEGARLLDAERNYQQGMGFARKRRWAEALPYIEESFRLNPNEAEYAMQCGIVKMNLRDGDRAKNWEEARKNLLRAAELDTGSGEAFYRLGNLHKLMGDDDKAFEYFQRALVRSPDHLQARMELRLLGARKKMPARKK